MMRQFSFLFGLCAVSIFLSSMAQGDLTAYWSFDSDYSSSGNNATMQGVKQGNVSISNDDLLVPMSGMYIGDFQDGNGSRHFDGYIDEMAVFNHEPTAEVITGLYDGTYTPTESFV